MLTADSIVLPLCAAAQPIHLHLPAADIEQSLCVEFVLSPEIAQVKFDLSGIFMAGK